MLFAISDSNLHYKRGRDRVPGFQVPRPTDHFLHREGRLGPSEADDNNATSDGRVDTESDENRLHNVGKTSPSKSGWRRDGRFSKSLRRGSEVGKGCAKAEEKGS